jgi:hypothetical protein
VRRVFPALLVLGGAALVAGAEPDVLAVRLTTIDFRTALRVLTRESVPPGEVVREGPEVVIRVPGNAPEDLALPTVTPPLEAIHVVREPGVTVLRVQVAPEVPFEPSYEPGMLTVVFGEPPGPETRGPVTPELYHRLFPAGPEGPSAGGEEEAQGEGFRSMEHVGLAVGRLTLRPYLTTSWVDADVLAFEDATPVRDRYLQLTPGVTASMPLLAGTLAAEYEPRLRFFSDIPVVNTTSHFAGLRLETPVGSRTLLRIGHRFTRATLETDVVDPGHEYFFGLAPYTFNATTLTGRVDLGPRLFAEGEAGWRWARFEPGSGGGFFDYDSSTVRAGLGYDVGSDLRAVFSYAFERIPPSPDRALVETTAQSVLGTLNGQIGPLMSGSASIGWRHQTNPLASGPSRSFDGLTVGASLRRELGYASTLEIQAVRASDPSSFEGNAYYVNNSVTLALTVPAPFETWARGSFGWLRNAYPNDASATGSPRHDRILGWSLGVGRQIGWRAWVRADYRRETRESNLPGYDLTTDGFIVQLGVGLFGPSAGARP